MVFESFVFTLVLDRDLNILFPLDVNNQSTHLFSFFYSAVLSRYYWRTSHKTGKRIIQRQCLTDFVENISRET